MSSLTRTIEKRVLRSLGLRRSVAGVVLDLDDNVVGRRWPRLCRSDDGVYSWRKL